ncbi:hypothetical protein DXA96_05560 [Lachnospiraceae bacterium OF09-33XD]|nr:hypothetical protein DXA96_05560 [Lachnospiraceae bacterium OF09-33XD]
MKNFLHGLRGGFVPPGPREAPAGEGQGFFPRGVTFIHWIRTACPGMGPGRQAAGWRSSFWNGTGRKNRSCRRVWRL